MRERQMLFNRGIKYNWKYIFNTQVEDARGLINVVSKYVATFILFNFLID